MSSVPKREIAEPSADETLGAGMPGAASSAAYRKTAPPKASAKIVLPGTRIFKNIPFLVLFSFTIMNAFLYIYLAANDFPAIDQSSADAIIREAFGKDYTFFSPFEQFLFEVKSTDELGYPEFRKSLSKMNEGISGFGIHLGDFFGRRSFRFSNGGIYWSAPAIEGKTAYKPRFD